MVTCYVSQHSRYQSAINAGAEGGARAQVPLTSIYSTFDEIVLPQGPQVCTVDDSDQDLNLMTSISVDLQGCLLPRRCFGHCSPRCLSWKDCGSFVGYPSSTHVMMLSWLSLLSVIVFQWIHHRLGCVWNRSHCTDSGETHHR